MSIEYKNFGFDKGMDWLQRGWALFMRAPGPMVLLGLLLLVINMAAQAIPFIGALAIFLFGPALTGGALLAIGKLHQSDDGKLDIADIFQPFQEGRWTDMLMLAVPNIVFLAIMLVAGIVLMGGAILGAVSAGAVGGAEELFAGVMGVGVLLWVLLTLAMAFVVLTVMLYAVPLVIIDRQEAAPSFAVSLKATLANFMPWLVLGLIFVLLAIVATIPMMLGWLVLYPLSLAVLYISYLDIFAATASPQPAAAPTATPAPPPAHVEPDQVPDAGDSGPKTPQTP